MVSTKPTHPTGQKNRKNSKSWTPPPQWFKNFLFYKSYIIRFAIKRWLYNFFYKRSLKNVEFEPGVKIGKRMHLTTSSTTSASFFFATNSIRIIIIYLWKFETLTPYLLSKIAKFSNWAKIAKFSKGTHIWSIDWDNMFRLDLGSAFKIYFPS